MGESERLAAATASDLAAARQEAEGLRSRLAEESQRAAAGDEADAALEQEREKDR